ncbi:hypothetical protein SALWKB2_0678 [Snodgrassella alvi wkB2]|nr:hypothetical protein SALWKB2_0678 [Snodgrassella alvi wkB2]
MSFKTGLKYLFSTSYSDRYISTVPALVYKIIVTLNKASA